MEVVVDSAVSSTKLVSDKAQQTWEVASLPDAIQLATASNAFAAAIYGARFKAICEDGAALTDLDMLAIQVADVRIPVLRSGANKYYELSSKPASFNSEAFLRVGLTPDCHLIVPEPAGLAGDFLPGGWDPTVAIRSCDLTAIDGLHVATLGNLSLAASMRFFDSHWSVPFYWQLCIGLIASRGFRCDLDAFHCFFRPYKGDLASRFSEESSFSMFVSNRFFHSETPGTMQSGKRRIFINPNAPNRQHLLLVGDSHSYSSMSHIFSHYFEKVTFFWANRANRYGAVGEQIETVAREADFFIEETSERFFLRNFTVADNCPHKSA